MPRAPRTPADSQLPSSTLIIDNGAYTMKAGFAPVTTPADVLSSCGIVPNAIARMRDGRTYIGSQLNSLTDWTEATFRRPVERGQLVNWEAEREIWEHTFFDNKTAKKDLLVTDPVDTTLLITESPNCITELRRNTDEIVMEEWGFGGYVRCLGVCVRVSG